MNKWTKPYCGISHYGELGDIRRASIHAPMVDNGSWEIILFFKENDGFGTIREGFRTEIVQSERKAKEYAEAWVNQIQKNTLTREQMFSIVDELKRFLEELEDCDVTENDVSKFKRITEGIF